MKTFLQLAEGKKRYSCQNKHHDITTVYHAEMHNKNIEECVDGYQRAPHKIGHRGGNRRTDIGSELF